MTQRGSRDLERENNLSKIMIGCSIDVHRAFGPGLLESAYAEYLAYELFQNKLATRREAPMPIVYKDVKLDQGDGMDILVDEHVVIELKAVEALTDVHKAQTLPDLRLGGYRLGGLINFNVSLLKNGIKRIIN